MKKQIIQTSETKVILRSKINLNPYNPKHHGDNEIALQKKNIKKMGYMGGIVYNMNTHNLIDGHRRVMALDLIHKYDGTPETDYEVKVEVVALGEKEEKEQMLYMAVGNTKVDYNLIAPIIDDVDYNDIGITEAEYKQILDLKDDLEDMLQTDTMEIMEELFAPKRKEVTELQDTKGSEEVMREHVENSKMSKEEGVEKKHKAMDAAVERQDNEDLYVVISFENEEQKRAFCESVGVQETRNMILEASVVLSCF